MMQPTQAVGIDLGTTYSCIAHLNEKGEPVTLPNSEGELCTPSVVEFDRPQGKSGGGSTGQFGLLPGTAPKFTGQLADDSDGSVIVGSEALKNSILNPDRIVQNAKRYMGDSSHRWNINGKPYSPVDVSSFILKKLLSGAHRQIGPIEHAVITVPAQFSDAQRHATMEAGYRAGLDRVDLINEPVAAALCHVLGAEGLWFSELAGEQRILVYDLGGGTFDLSIVRYRKDEVSVVATSGDLNLGGLNWNAALLDAICGQFEKEFRSNPRTDPKSLQALALEVERTKRALSVRPRAPLTCEHAGHKKVYQVELSQFEQLTKPLVERTAEITEALLRDNKMGWAHIDVVLITGGSSRMPMIRRRLKEMSGRTLNTTLSPDLSIAQGATYYAGMLLSNNKFAKSILNREATGRLARVKQQSVNARALGILVRDTKTGQRQPHYLIAPNSPLPAEATEIYGTVVPNQRRVNLQIIESGTDPEKPWVRLGSCVIDGLPPNLPEGSRINVTISYDTQARVNVSARDETSGLEASAQILRQQNLLPQLGAEAQDDSEIALVPVDDAPPPRPFAKSSRPQSEPSAPVQNAPAAASAPVRPVEPAAKSVGAPSTAARRTEMKQRPKVSASDGPNTDELVVAICSTCKEPLDEQGRCRTCPPPIVPTPKRTQQPAAAAPKPIPKKVVRPQKAARPAPQQPPKPVDDLEEEFWKYVE